MIIITTATAITPPPRRSTAAWQTIRPNLPEAFGSLGLTYRRQGRWTDAVANLLKALELDPQNMRDRNTLAAQLLAMRHYDESRN